MILSRGIVILKLAKVRENVELLHERKELRTVDLIIENNCSEYKLTGTENPGCYQQKKRPSLSMAAAEGKFQELHQ